MRYLFLILALLAALILACGCTGATTAPIDAAPIAPTAAATVGGTPAPTQNVQDYTFTQTITYTGENGTTVITKDKLAKTATVDIKSSVGPAPAGFNQIKYHELAATVTGNLMRVAYFNETALEELKAAVAEWNAQEYVIKDDSPPEQQETAPGENPLDGYTVQRATARLQDRSTGAGIAEIVVDGPDKEDVVIIYL